MDGSIAQRVTVTYDVPDADESWELTEENVPEPAWHDATVDSLKLALRTWAARADVSALIVSDLALRWQRDRWKVGVAPDVALYIPPPPEGEEAENICTWEPGHGPPRVAIEVVDPCTATRDYVLGPDQYAASGTKELWVFDPKRLGPKVHGGPFILQVWRRDEAGGFRQLYRGNGPCQSPELGTWLVVTDQGKRLRLADDPEGTRLWPTAEESAEQERSRVDKRAVDLEAEGGLLRAEIERLRARA